MKPVFLIPWMVLGCLPLPPNPRPDTGLDLAAVDVTPPDIDHVSIACRPDDGLWRLQMRVRGWVERVRTWWTTDGQYVETHTLVSHAYEPQGTGEVLFLDLPIAPDVRLVSDGAFTAFSCGDAPSIRWSVVSVDGPVHACVHTGDGFDAWSEVPGLPACPDEER